MTFQAGYATARFNPLAISGGVDNTVQATAVFTLDGPGRVSVPSAPASSGASNYGITTADFSDGAFIISPNISAADREIGSPNRNPDGLVRQLNNIIQGVVTSEPAYQFSSVSYSYVSHYIGTEANIVMFYFGYPSVAGALTAVEAKNYMTVTRSYQVLGAPQGTVLDKGEASTTAALSIDRAAHAVSVTINVVYNGENLGTFSGSASFTTGANRFAGNLTSGAPSPLSGSFSGALFGTSGNEVGLAFALSGAPVISGVMRQRRVVGVVLGK